MGLPPDGTPLYVGVKEAARLAGVSREQMYEWVNRKADPMPHIERGVRKMVRVSAIPGYARREEAL